MRRGIAAAAVAALGLAAPAFGADGDLDPSFGTGGLAESPCGNRFEDSGVTAQANGRVVVAGTRDGRMCVARLLEDGRPDPSFGDGGVTLVDVGVDPQARELVLEPGGKLLLAGSSRPNSSDPPEATVVRLDSDGHLDGSFSNDGIATHSGTPGVHEIAVDGDGRIWVAGEHLEPGGTGVFAEFGYHALELRTDGSFVRTVSGPAGANFRLAALELDEHGRPVMLGTHIPTSGFPDFMAIRLTPFGSLDTTFGAGGYRTVGFGGSEIAGDVVMRPSGGMWLAGTGVQDGEGYLAVAQLTDDGDLDQTFSTDGRQSHGGVGDKADVRAAELAIDGKLVVAGRSGSASTDFMVAKLLSNGALDAGFAGDGIRTFDAGGEGAAQGLVRDGFGRLVGVGVTNAGVPSARFHAFRLEDSAVALSVSDAVADEGGSALFELTLSKPSGVPVPVVLETEGEGAVPGRDYLHRSVTLVFEPGETQKTYGVPVLADALLEGPERFTAIGLPRIGIALDPIGTATVTNVLRDGRCANLRRGTSRGERLRGSAAGDRIVAGAGDDRLSGLAGDDCLEGGSGADRILAGGGRNRVAAGSGNDLISSDNGRTDRIDCGPGRDRVVADRRDRVRNCESVRRAGR